MKTNNHYLITDTRSFHTARTGNNISAGLFYLAHRMEKMGLQFYFSELNNIKIKKCDYVYLSFMLEEHRTIINVVANKIVIGGIGAKPQNIIADNKRMLFYRGCSAYFNKDVLEMDGIVTRPLLPDDVEMPLIPRQYLKAIKVIPFNNGHGCFYKKCTFCQRKAAVVLDPEIVAAAITRIYKKYRKQVQLCLDGPSWEYLSKICDLLLRSGQKARWGCSAMASYLNSKSLKKLRDAGCISLGVGIEYLDDATLHYIKKNSTVEQYFNIIKTATNLGIYLHLCIINFDPYVPERTAQNHHKNLNKILSMGNRLVSFSFSELGNNQETSRAIEALNKGDDSNETMHKRQSGRAQP